MLDQELQVGAAMYGIPTDGSFYRNERGRCNHRSQLLGASLSTTGSLRSRTDGSASTWSVGTNYPFWCPDHPDQHPGASSRLIESARPKPYNARGSF